MNKQGAKQGYFDVMPNISSATANYVAWESDIMFNNVTDSGNRVELRFYAGKNSAADRMYVLYINVPTTKSGGNITIQPAGASEAPVTVAKLGEWFTLRYEYFGGNASTPASFKVYINDMKTPVIVDYKVQVGSAVSASTVKFSRFITMNAFKGEIYFDDMSFVQGLMTDYVQLPATHNKDVAGSVPGGDDSGSSGGGGTTVTNPVFNSKPSGNVTFDDLEAGRFNPGSVGDLLINQIKQDNATTSTEIVSEGDIKYLTMNKSDVSDTSAGQTWLVIQRNVTGDDLTVPIVFEASMRHTQIKNTSQTYFRFYEGRTAASGSDGTKIGGNLNFTPSGDSVKVGDNVVGKLGEWFTLRFVIVGTTVSIYANDENGKMVKIADHTHGGDLTKISTIVLMNDTTTLHKTDFNYIYFGRNSDLAASADPLSPVTPNASSGGTTETPDTPAEAPKGPMSFDAIAEGDFALDTSRDSVLIGKANHSTDVVSSLKIVSDGDNKYLFFDKEENAPDANGEIKNRMCWLVLERTEEAGADGVLYFEAKLNLTSKNTNTETHIRFYNGRTAAKPGSGGTEITSSSTRPGFYVKDGKVYINKVEIGAAGEWITVRLAMGAESTTVYVLDAEGKWVESSTIAVAGLNATTSVQLTMNTAGANTILLDDVYFGPSYSDAEVK